MNKETGTYDFVSKKDSIKNIEIFTQQFKRGRISSDEYIKIVHENLQKLANKRDYINYLMSIGQMNS